MASTSQWNAIRDSDKLTLEIPFDFANTGNSIYKHIVEMDRTVDSMIQNIAESLLSFGYKEQQEPAQWFSEESLFVIEKSRHNSGFKITLLGECIRDSRVKELFFLLKIQYS